MSYKKDNKIKSNFTSITISLASPETILERSSGEVTKPETINYRTYKPERDGLFCERIFGPVKDYECHCGKYKRIRYKGIVCDRCGVEVTEKKVRRERMGHINLVVPVAHIWYFRSLPNKIGYLLGLPTKKLDMIIYYERYVVIQPGIKEEDGISYMDFLTEEEYLDILDTLPKENQYLDDNDPQKFIAKMGAEALEDLLKRLDLDQLSYDLRHQAANETSQQRKNDSLFDNSRKVNAVKTEGNRALKSLSDILKGKQGRFRQNLLGKRVDYSARSVIVVGPHLKLHECGLPKDMAAELYKPFIIRKMIERGIVKTVKSAKKIVDRKDPVVWDILENVLKGHPVLLNRAPTLHRLGIQAFQPTLVEGKAIQLHPLVCTAFNADFDGDQMAVHLPLGNAAILEAQILMLAAHNILNPANGSPVTVPSQDMVLGLYYITKGRKSDDNRKMNGEGSTFYSAEEVIIALNEAKVDLHSFIKVKTRVKTKEGEFKDQIIDTTVGRVIFNQIVPEEVGYINELLTKKSLRNVIGEIVKNTGMARAAKFLDDMKELGFQTAFKGGLSFNLQDLNIPAAKADLIQQATNEVEEVMNNYNMGFITNNERYNQIIDIWTRINNKLTAHVMDILSNDNQGFNSVYMMLDSGARGSKIIQQHLYDV